MACKKKLKFFVLLIQRYVYGPQNSYNTGCCGWIRKFKESGSYAIKLGLELRADVMALHVVPAGKHFPEENLEKGTKHDYAYLDKIAEQSISAGVDLEIEIIRAESPVVNEIVEYADKKNIDLIIVGIRSVSEFRFMLGSTATGIVVNAPVQC